MMTMITDAEVTMTTYKAADGKPIAGEFTFVSELDWFDANDEPTELVEEVWVRQSHRTIVAPHVDGRCCVFEVSDKHDWCEEPAVAWVRTDARAAGYESRCQRHSDGVR